MSFGDDFVHTGIRGSWGLGVVVLALLGSSRVEAQDLPKFSQYKRVHQKALDWWEQGRLDDAAQALAAAAQKKPADAETRYWQAVIAAEQNDHDGALAHLTRALELGLPAERCVLGTQSGLAAIHALPGWPEFRARLPALLFHGPTLGAVTDTSARIWVRTEGSLEVTAWAELQVDTAVGPGHRVDSTPVTTGPDQDFTAVLELRGLHAGGRYTYGVRLGGVDEPAGMLSLAHGRGEPTRMRVAFGGGSGYVPQNERAWDTIRDQTPDALFLLGDNVYSDAPESRAMQHYCYYRRQSRAEYRRLVQNVPTFAIWDDHDFGTNDCLGGATVGQPPWKQSVWEVFQRNWPNPDYAWGEGPGCWFDHWIGDVHFVFLDGRAYRVRPKKPATPTMLGERQNAWLREVLDPGATFTVLISPVPWTFGAKGDSKDTWNGFRAERDALFADLDELGMEGVVLMSADRHRSDLWKISRTRGYDLYEFNSSRLTNQHVHPEMAAAEFSYNKKQSFGLVDFDTTLEDPTIRYQIVSIDGEAIHGITLRRSQLR